MLQDDYLEAEERINAWTHGTAALFATIATFCLIVQAQHSSLNQILSPRQINLTLLVYGASMVLLFAASMFYHAARDPKLRFWLKKLDHTAIYYLIAGTYTPFLVLFIPTQKAKILLIALWIIALLGTFFKLFLIHRFQRLSLIAYIVMGWLAVFVIDDMYTYLSRTSLSLLVLGGVLYTLGTYFYASTRYLYSHAIWHIFVIAGAASHFFAIWTMLTSFTV